MPRIDRSTYPRFVATRRLVYAYVSLQAGWREETLEDRGAGRSVWERATVRSVERAGKRRGPRILDKDEPRKEHGTGKIQVRLRWRGTRGWRKERLAKRGVCSEDTHRRRPGLCKSSANSHLADRFLCHYATAEKAVVPPSYVCLFTPLLKSQTEKVEGRLLAVPDIRMLVCFFRCSNRYRVACLLAARL